MIREYDVETNKRNEFVNITGIVRRAVEEAGIVGDGEVMVYVPHTTGAVTINEGADPDVPRDILTMLDRLVPEQGDYRHAEGNSDAHCKSVLVGSSVRIPIAGGILMLGSWQAVFFCEFDGPRKRRVVIRAAADTKKG